MIFKKYSLDKIDYYLIGLLTTLSIFSFNSLGEKSIWFMQREWIYETHGLFSFIESIQLILLISNIILIFINRKILIKKTKNILAFAIRIFIPIFIIFEETSYFFKDYFKESFLSKLNMQGEANFHNLDFNQIVGFANNQFGSNIVIDDYKLKVIIYSFVFIILSLGGFLPFLKKFNLIFFEKRFLMFGLIFIFNIFFSLLIRKYFGIMNTSSSYYFLSDEFIELFYYQLLLLDLRQKITKAKVKI